MRAWIVKRWIGCLGLAWAASGSVWGQGWGLEYGVMPADLERQFVESSMAKSPFGFTLTPANRLQARSHVAAYVTQDSLVLHRLESGCTLLLCGNTCLAAPRHRWAFPLPGTAESAPPPMALIRTDVNASMKVMSAVVVISRPGNRIHRMLIEIDDTMKGSVTGKVIDLETPEVPGGKVTALAGLRMGEDQARPGFLAYGTSGLAYLVREDGSTTVATLWVPGSEGRSFTAAGPPWRTAPSWSGGPWNGCPYPIRPPKGSIQARVPAERGTTGI